MRLSIDVTLEYRLDRPQPALLAVEPARSPGQATPRSHTDVAGARLRRIAGEAGVGTRLWADVPDTVLRLRHTAEIAVAAPGAPLESLAAAPMDALPAEMLTWLRPSRLVQCDAFAGFAASRFGDLSGGARMAAIRDWVRDEIAYLPATSHTDTTVLDTFARREGVCRDFAHVTCALARAAGIPARYAAVYGLGVDPPDFHAVAQVWLGGAWRLVDATGMCAPGEMAVIGVGRDACDAPFMETEGEATPVFHSVSVTGVPD